MDHGSLHLPTTRVLVQVRPSRAFYFLGTCLPQIGIPWVRAHVMYSFLRTYTKRRARLLHPLPSVYGVLGGVVPMRVLKQYIYMYLVPSRTFFAMHQQTHPHS